MQERSKLTDVAPKDVKRLEVLKPVNIPSMGERLKQALEKERRLEAASRPAQKEAIGTEKEKEEESPKRQDRKRKKKKTASQTQVNKNALNEKDEVQEGVDWSDDDE